MSMLPTLSPAMPALTRAMDFRVERAGVLAGNIANADTPGYRRRELQFDKLLGKELRGLERTDVHHFSTRGAVDAGFRHEVGPPGTRPDGNGVDLDSELIEVNRNAGAFADQATVLARLSSLLKTAVGGR